MTHAVFRTRCDWQQSTPEELTMKTQVEAPRASAVYLFRLAANIRNREPAVYLDIGMILSFICQHLQTHADTVQVQLVVGRLFLS